MGAEASTESGEEFLRGFQNKYSFTKEINDSRFGDIQIYKENGGEGFVFLKSHWCQSEEDYNVFLKQCQRRVNSPHKNVLKMIGYSQSSDTQLCGDFSKITVYYEYYPHNMERELDRRHNRSEFFNEQEIWFLLESVIGACAYFEQQKIYHGDIRPQNILLTNEGFVKIADHGLVHSDKNGYIKALQYGEQAYLSPILMRGLANRETNPVQNVFKSDVYSLGMTMLEVINLYTARSCYDYNSGTIIKPVIDDLVMRGRQRYSEFLMNIIQELIQEDETKRPNFLELSTLLAPYQDAIQNLQPFTPNQFPGIPQQQAYVQQQPIPAQQNIQSQGPMFQSQIQAQPLQQQQIGQSQIIYQQNPYGSSPDSIRKQQQFEQTQQVIPQQQLHQTLQQPIQQSQIQTQPQYSGVQSQYIPQQQVKSQYSPSQISQQNLNHSQTNIQTQQPVYSQHQPVQQTQTLPTYQQPLQQQHIQSQSPQQQSPQFQSPSQQSQYLYQQPAQEQHYGDINQRVNEALKHSEETIQKHSSRGYEQQQVQHQPQPQYVRQQQPPLQYQQQPQQQYQQPIYQQQPPQYQHQYQ